MHHVCSQAFQNLNFLIFCYFILGDLLYFAIEQQCADTLSTVVINGILLQNGIDTAANVHAAQSCIDLIGVVPDEIEIEFEGRLQYSESDCGSVSLSAIATDDLCSITHPPSLDVVPPVHPLLSTLLKNETKTQFELIIEGNNELIRIQNELPTGGSKRSFSN